jgi:lysophospholipase L1-like esterase
MFKKISELRQVFFITFVFGFIFTYGVIVGAYQVFPFYQIYAIKQLVIPKPVAEARNRAYRIELFEEFPQAADIVFIGDGMTESAEWSDFFPGLKVANRGVAGDKISDVVRRMDSVFIVRPRVAFVTLGIVDIFDGVPLDEMVANYRQIIDVLTAKGIKVVVQSTISCAPSMCGQASVLTVNVLNQRLTSLADELGVSFLHLSGLSSTQGLNWDYTYDGVHLSATGYRRWVETIYAEGFVEVSTRN